jgi:hypothetical protein
VLAAAISFSEARNHTGPISYTRRVGDYTHIFIGQNLLLSLICEQNRHTLCRDLANVQDSKFTGMLHMRHLISLWSSKWY